METLQNGGCNSFWSDSILFNESYVASIITALTLTLGVNEPLQRATSEGNTYQMISVPKVIGYKKLCFHRGDFNELNYSLFREGEERLNVKKSSKFIAVSISKESKLLSLN